MAVARLPPPESAALDLVSRELGIGMGTLERWRKDAQSGPGRGRARTAGARLDTVITTAMSEIGKSAWRREHGVYPVELDQWRPSCTGALSDPGDARASLRATRAGIGCCETLLDVLHLLAHLLDRHLHVDRDVGQLQGG